MDFTPCDLGGRAAPVVDIVRDSLLDGIAMVPEAHDLLAVAPNPWFDAHVVRRVAHDRLLRAAPPSGRPWSIDRQVANSGIHLRVGADRIHVARGDIDRVPNPGKSRRRQAFYSQQVLNLGYASMSEAGVEPLNLLCLWAPTSDGVALHLAVPTGTWKFGGHAKLRALVSLDDDSYLTAEFAGDDDAGDDLVVDMSAEADEEGGEAG